MGGVYFKTRPMPVPFLKYVASTALTLLITIDIKEMSNESILTVTGATGSTALLTGSNTHYGLR